MPSKFNKIPDEVSGQQRMEQYLEKLVDDGDDEGIEPSRPVNWANYVPILGLLHGPNRNFECSVNFVFLVPYVVPARH